MSTLVKFETRDIGIQIKKPENLSAKIENKFFAKDRIPIYPFFLQSQSLISSDF